MNTATSSNRSNELSRHTRATTEHTLFRIPSAIAVFLRYELMAGCVLLLVWLNAAIWLSASDRIGDGGWEAWRARPGAAVATQILVAWIAGLWLLKSTHRRWPQFWSRAEALHGFGITARLPYRQLAIGVMVGLAVVGAEVLIDHWLLPRQAVEHSLFALAERSTLLAQMAVAGSAVTIVPLVEEVMYRGVLLTALLGYGIDTVTASPAPARTVTAVALTSAIFALRHGPAYAWHAWPLVWTGLGGIAMSWVRLRTRSLWPAVALHATVNFVGSIGIFVAG